MPAFQVDVIRRVRHLDRGFGPGMYRNGIELVLNPADPLEILDLAAHLGHQAGSGPAPSRAAHHAPVWSAMRNYVCRIESLHLHQERGSRATTHRPHFRSRVAQDAVRHPRAARLVISDREMAARLRFSARGHLRLAFVPLPLRLSFRDRIPGERFLPIIAPPRVAGKLLRCGLVELRIGTERGG